MAMMHKGRNGINTRGNLKDRIVKICVKYDHSIDQLKRKACLYAVNIYHRVIELFSMETASLAHLVYAYQKHIGKVLFACI